VSRSAIVAVLVRKDIVGGERLVAFSLASFANRDARAPPSAAVAAARAGLGRARYLQAREELVRRGLLVVADAARGGRGRSSTLDLAFALDGPWWEGDINAELFETVLGCSHARGPARLLLAAMAAVADADEVVEGVSTAQLRACAGIADRTYRRARATLIASGEIALLSGVGGRGNTNRCGWSAIRARSTTGRRRYSSGERLRPRARGRSWRQSLRPPLRRKTVRS
jgi:hypothetical protein